jgi:late competence protein required for DNA uptake (superfamily II DNA/RNA helicase)
MATGRCERCSGEARLTSLIPPFGRDPGRRIFYCEQCHHFTRVTWPGYFQQLQQQQQQQQQQPPPLQKEDE